MPLQRNPLDLLTDKQRAFVEVFAAMGGGNSGAGMQAVQTIWPGTSDTVARTTANRHLHNPKVLAALRHLSGDNIVRATTRAVSVLEEIMDGSLNGQAVKPAEALKAAQAILDRGGLPAVSKVEHENVTETLSERELTQEIAALLKDLREQGVNIPGVVDADCVPVLKTVDPDVPDPAAPWGRRKDGLPCGRPGYRKPIGAQGPKPYTEEELAAMSPVERAQKLALQKKMQEYFDETAAERAEHVEKVKLKQLAGPGAVK